MSGQQPGWYYAQGDPPGTQRYWDGELWQGQPTPIAQPQAYSSGYQTYPENSQATLSLVLSICGIVICGLLSPLGWYFGQQELNGINAGLRDPNNRGTAKAGKIVGMIWSILMLVGIAIFIVAIAASA